MKKLMVLFVLLFVSPLYATVSTGESIREYFSTALSPTEFTFTQPANSSDDILVYSHVTATGVQALLVEDTDYTIAPTGGDYLNGGVVTIDPAPATTLGIVVVRSIKKSQETSSGGINPLSIVDALDKLARTVQDMQDRNDRSIHLQESDADSFTMELPGKDERVGYLFFDDDGNMTFVDSVVTGTITASAFGESLIQAATALAARVLLELTTTDAVEFAAITGTTGTFTGAVSTAAITASGDVTMATAKTLTTEIIKAVDATGILLKNDGGDTVLTIKDDGTALLADGAAATTQTAEDDTTAIATTKYVKNSNRVTDGLEGVTGYRYCRVEDGSPALEQVFTKYFRGTLDADDTTGVAHGVTYTNILSITVMVEEQGQSRFRFIDLKTGTIPSSTTLGIELYVTASNIIFAGVGSGFQSGDYRIKMEYTI